METFIKDMKTRSGNLLKLKRDMFHDIVEIWTLSEDGQYSKSHTELFPIDNEDYEMTNEYRRYSAYVATQLEL